MDKPVIILVRGPAVGLGFTMLSYADFVYCTHDAMFIAPFMQSSQSPEGGSTYFFPRIFGRKLSNEVLLNDKLLNAKDALSNGLVNAVLPSSDSEDYDLLSLPCMKKLLSNNMETMRTAKRLLNSAENSLAVSQALVRERTGLKSIWIDPDFPDKMMVYLLSLKKPKK